MTKYYRVTQDNFLWEKGAILKHSAENDIVSSRGGYSPENDIWDITEHNGTEYISAPIIENNPDWFERVYEVKGVSKVLYKTKSAAKEYLSKSVK